MSPDADPGNIRIDREYGGVVLIKQGDDEVVVTPERLSQVAGALMDYALDRLDFQRHIDARRRPLRNEAPASDTEAPQTTTTDRRSGSDRHG